MIYSDSLTISSYCSLILLTTIIVYWLSPILLHYIYLYWSINLTMLLFIDSTHYLNWSSFYSQYWSYPLSNCVMNDSILSYLSFLVFTSLNITSIYSYCLSILLFIIDEYSPLNTYIIRHKWHTTYNILYYLSL